MVTLISNDTFPIGCRYKDFINKIQRYSDKLFCNDQSAIVTLNILDCKIDCLYRFEHGRLVSILLTTHCGTSDALEIIRECLTTVFGPAAEDHDHGQANGLKYYWPHLDLDITAGITTIDETDTSYGAIIAVYLPLPGMSSRIPSTS